MTMCGRSRANQQGPPRLVAAVEVRGEGSLSNCPRKPSLRGSKSRGKGESKRDGRQIQGMGETAGADLLNFPEVDTFYCIR